MEDKFDVRGAIIQTVFRQGYIHEDELQGLLKESNRRMSDVSPRAYRLLTKFGFLRFNHAYTRRARGARHNLGDFV